jgi:sterol desaturase/sphingolipid hydroxylase (fatty acid hydroxylase superfamily)
VTFISVFWAFLIHANVKWRFGPLEHILSSPRFHHWHHSRDDHPNHNFASMLPFYDRLFGTHHLPSGAWPPSYGIAPENDPDVLIAAQQDTTTKAKEAT